MKFFLSVVCVRAFFFCWIFIFSSQVSSHQKVNKSEMKQRRKTKYPVGKKWKKKREKKEERRKWKTTGSFFFVVFKLHVRRVNFRLGKVDGNDFVNYRFTGSTRLGVIIFTIRFPYFCFWNNIFTNLIWFLLFTENWCFTLLLPRLGGKNKVGKTKMAITKLKLCQPKKNLNHLPGVVRIYERSTNYPLINL